LAGGQACFWRSAVVTGGVGSVAIALLYRRERARTLQLTRGVENLS
jgi:hypothetical protein